MFVEWAHMRPHQDPAAYHAELSRWSLSLTKRCVDLLLSVAALLLFWPLLLVTALLVLYDSPGPVIFAKNSSDAMESSLLSSSSGLWT